MSPSVGWNGHFRELLLVETEFKWLQQNLAAKLILCVSNLFTRFFSIYEREGGGGLQLNALFHGNLIKMSFDFKSKSIILKFLEQRDFFAQFSIDHCFKDSQFFFQRKVYIIGIISEEIV